MEKQMTAYSKLLDTAEEKGGNAMKLSCTKVLVHYFYWSAYT